MVTNLETESNLETDEIRDLDDLKKEIKLNRGSDNIEQIEKPVEPQVIIDAIFEYFNKEINNTTLILKTWKFSQEEKENIKNILSNYLSKHTLLVIWSDRKVKIDIDNKKALISTIKKIWKIIGKKIIDKKKGTNFFWKIKWKILNAGISIGWTRYIGNIEEKIKKMNYKECMDIIFGYVWGIIKIVLERINWNMTNEELFWYFIKYFPIDNETPKNSRKKNEKNSEIIKKILLHLKKNNEDIKVDVYNGFNYKLWKKDLSLNK